MNCHDGANTHTPDPTAREFAQALHQHLEAGNATILMHGSRGRGDHREWSDIDVQV